MKSKAIFGLFAFAVVSFGLATLSVPTARADSHRITICHRTNSATNPYTSIEVDKSAADGIAGNSGKEADHYGEHKGPIASSLTVAIELKKDKVEWGDIIPPIEGVHAGQNWTEGEAMLKNDCNYTSEVNLPFITAAVVCATVDEQIVIQLTVANEGNVSGTATINGIDATIAAGDVLVKSFTPNTLVTVFTGDDLILSETLECKPGQGGEEPQVPVTPDAPKPPVTPENPKTPETPESPIVLPFTSGVATPIVVVGALSLLGAVLAAGSAIKSRILA